jgi:hypothetical protein
MQIYFPNFKTKQAAIALFDFIDASRYNESDNVIFNSDLNLEDLSNLPGGTRPIEKYNIYNEETLYSFLGHTIQNFLKNSGQLCQDSYVTWKLKNKSNGTFVEVGTGYPSGGNNTWRLESELGWNGVLVEPNPYFHTSIRKIRSSPLETSAIYTKSNVQIPLIVPVGFAPGGGFEEYFENKIGDSFDDREKIISNTISIIDCFKKYHIPQNFDYLSFDTTGNIIDIPIIESMLINQYLPKIITIGHNYKSHRSDLHSMLQSHGYIREFDYLSRWDDWYYHNSLEEH